MLPRDDNKGEREGPAGIPLRVIPALHTAWQDTEVPPYDERHGQEVQKLGFGRSFPKRQLVLPNGNGEGGER